MGILWCRETVRDRRYEVSDNNGGAATRSFLVRVDDPGTSLTTIQSEPGIQVGDVYADDPSLLCQKISVRPKDDVGMLFEVTADYAYKEQESEDPENDPPGSLPGLVPFWGASSSVGSQPTYLTTTNRVITNSAGDPLEGLEADEAQFHLTLTQYYDSHTQWLPLARSLTNSVNNAEWNGGATGTWKCQGCSAKVNIDRQGEDGAARVKWEVTWDFAYKEPTWQLQPWDIGFNELVDANGDPIEVPGIAPTSDQYGGSGGSGSGDDDGPCEGNLGRRAILGQDGRPVRQPVALQNGKAKAPCLRPNRLEFQIYAENDFMAPFGELRTPVV